jgi:hypothetical protein
MKPFEISQHELGIVSRHLGTRCGKALDRNAVQLSQDVHVAQACLPAVVTYLRAAFDRLLHQTRVAAALDPLHDDRLGGRYPAEDFGYSDAVF